MERDELSVIRFFESIGIKRTIKGYCYLKKGVLLCLEDPTITCQSICESVISAKDTKSNWKSIYRACRYAIKTSDNEKYCNMSPSAFFKEVSNAIHNENLERSVRGVSDK